MKPLNDLEHRVYDVIVEYIMEHGYAPSVREIGQMVGFRSSATAHKHIERVARKGWIEIHGARAIKVHGYKYVKEENTHERTKDQGGVHRTVSWKCQQQQGYPQGLYRQ